MGDSKVHPSDTVVTVDKEMYKHFTVQWSDLTYTVEKSMLARTLGSICGQSVPQSKTILKGVKGQFKSGELTAIMGPSGAGKSTLLECVAGIRLKGRSGNISFHGKSNKINMAFIPQHDSFFGVLTVRESLLFASKLQNSTKANNKEDYISYTVTSTKNSKPPLTRRATISDKNFHNEIAENMMSLLGLEEVADVATSNISGGQKKRLSIAQELVSKPNILILDEPTSGLDSSASLQCIELLQMLTQQKIPMAIVCTIHQPNPRTFNIFNRVYILSTVGRCIYDGPPAELVDQLKKVDIECPSYYNPADFIIEVASVEHGMEPVDKLIALNALEQPAPVDIYGSPNTLEDVTVTPNYPFFHHLVYLFHRSFILILRNPMMTALRFTSHFFLAFFIGWIYGPNVGKAGGCPPDIEDAFDPKAMKAATNASIEQSKSMIDNFSCLFFNMMIILFSAMMPTIISFPLEMKVFVKEKRNNWYGVGSYFLGMILADTPFQIIFPAMYVAITYYATNQIRVGWRFEAYMYINILVALISQCQGLIMGAIFMNNMTAAVYVGPLSALPLLLFSGFLVKIETMPAILRPLTHLSFIRYSFEGAIVAIYGHDRCGADVQEKIDMMRALMLAWMKRMLSIVNRAISGDDEYPDDYPEEINSTKTEIPDQNELSEALVDTVIAGVGGGMRDSDGNLISGVMALFDLVDNDLYRSYIMLIIFFIVFRISTYFFVLWRANSRK